MKLTFTHAGVARTLNKHPRIQVALRRGQIGDAAARRTAWFLRVTMDGRERTFRLPAKDADAIRAAKDILNGAHTNPTLFSAWVAAAQTRKGITIGQLAAEWFATGLPVSKVKPRTIAAAARLRAALERCLPFWSNIAAASITPDRHEDFVAWRQQNVARGTGERSADLELSALSSLCQWAVLTGRLKENPFATRTRFAVVKRHCHEACPENDEALHRVLGWLFESPDPARRVAGAWLAYCALSGQRPGEPIALLRHEVLPATPTSTRELPCGSIFPAPDGSLRMKVMRLKHGQNPFITIHPALNDFLCAWRAYHSRHHRDENRLFPLITDLTALNRALEQATTALGLPHFKPHGFGRAYYVKVRRSQGADDATIAGELGQTTNGQLIRAVYGDPADMLGGQLFDWLPSAASGVPVAWQLLAQSDTSMIRQNVSKIPHGIGKATQPDGNDIGARESTETVAAVGKTVKVPEKKWCLGKDSNLGPID